VDLPRIGDLEPIHRVLRIRDGRDPEILIEIGD
jgi:uncharacterized protein (UPF0248 family)